MQNLQVTKHTGSPLTKVRDGRPLFADVAVARHYSASLCCARLTCSLTNKQQYTSVNSTTGMGSGMPRCGTPRGSKNAL